MPAFRDALTQLAALSVTGIHKNYDINTTPDDLSRAQLPALLVLPVETQEDGLFRDRGTGYQAIAFSNGTRRVSYRVTHLLLIAPVMAGKGSRSHLPQLITCIDAYFTALGDDITLNETLIEPAQVQVEPGVFTYGETEYHGCAFRHRWVMEV